MALLGQQEDKKDKRGQTQDKPRTQKGLAKGCTDKKYNFTKFSYVVWCAGAGTVLLQKNFMLRSRSLRELLAEMDFISFIRLSS